MSKDDERVLCFPRACLEQRFGSPLFNGFLPGDASQLESVFPKAEAQFVRRGDCETNSDLKQIIPYVAITCHRYGHQVLRYNRAKKGEGEQRLAGQASIGIGGHVTAWGDDLLCSIADLLRDAWGRELKEEVKLETDYSHRVVGFINDDCTSVGSVHFGVLIVLQVEWPCVYPNEPNIVRPHFAPYDAVRGDLNLEPWSKIALPYLK